MENSVKNLIQFIDHSPSCFHVIENAKKQFLEHGFIQLEEKEHWNLEEGKSYFVEGTKIDEHGDAHAHDGFCSAIRKAEVVGEVKNNKFVVSHFKLLPAEKK